MSTGTLKDQFVTSIVQNLPPVNDECMGFWIKNPTLLQKALKKILSISKKKNSLPNFTTFCILNLGTGFESVEDFCTAMCEKGICVSNCGKMMLKKLVPKFFKQSMEIELIEVSDFELGFEHGAVVGEVYARAKRHGLALCPPEVGPQLLLQYKNLRHDCSLLIAMKPVVVPNGPLSIFLVKRTEFGDLRLTSSSGDSKMFYDASYRWVFCIPKPNGTKSVA